jgi:3-deoxy-D-manno-octulosonic-acid transferase
LYQLYSILLAFGFVLALPFYLWKGRSTGKYLRTFRERMGVRPYPAHASGERAVWIHAVSVGEVLAARPLVLGLRERLPGWRIYLSTTTPTGQAIAAASVRGVDGVFYAPFDWPRPVRAALAALDPALLVLVEREIWPNLIHEARRRGARVAIANGRLSERSFSRYRLVRGFVRRVLGEVDLFLMQAPAHAERMRALGAPETRVRVTGNLKFDAAETPRPSEALESRIGKAARRNRPLLVAGSTTVGEEELVLAAFRRVRERVPAAALLIAPRHPERFDEVPPKVAALGLRCLRRSALEPGGWRDEEVVLLDTLGELASVYALADVVFVGGSLVPSGGHNILEPAAAGRPVTVGRHMENFQEIADQFRAAGALVQVADANELGDEVAALLLDEARRRELGERGRRLVEDNRGAVGRTLDALLALVA